MAKKKFFVFLILMFIASAHAEVDGARDYYVVSKTLNVRLAPSKDGKITNKLHSRQKVEVFEVKGEWARVSHYYDGAAEGVTGTVARWVSSEYLAPHQSPEEVTSVATSSVEKAIESSDDFSKYRAIFVPASEKLIDQGECGLEDFEEISGWLRSANYKPRLVYFTYCGGIRKNNRIYLDAETGGIFR